MTNRYPFRLGSRVFKLLMDLFLFHDFSVINFVRGFFVSIKDTEMVVLCRVIVIQVIINTSNST